jgi:hypothetical protein
MGMMIAASFIVAPIAGILLALRFKVFILIPAALLATALIVAIGHQPRLTIALTVIGTWVLLQIGYVLGIIARGVSTKTLNGILRRFLLKVDRGLCWLEGGWRIEKINNN